MAEGHRRIVRARAPYLARAVRLANHRILCTLPTAPIFVEIGAWRAVVALQAQTSTNIGSNYRELCERSKFAVQGPQRLLGSLVQRVGRKSVTMLAAAFLVAALSGRRVHAADGGAPGSLPRRWRCCSRHHRHPPSSRLSVVLVLFHEGLLDMTFARPPHGGWGSGWGFC